MTAARANQTDKESVRLLAIEYGIRETARKTGINPNTLLSWSKRYAWFQQPKSVIKQNGNAISAIKSPSSIVMDELAENERETRLSLSRYARRAAKDSESSSLRDAPLVHKAAQVAGIAYRWGDNDKQGQQFTLNVLNINSLQVEKPPTLDE